MKNLLSAMIALAYLLTGSAEAAILLNSPTTDWYAIEYLGGRSDYVNDEQTGINESDLVGSAVGVSPVQTAFYFRYDGPSNQVGFRVRVDGDSNPPGYTGAIWVGFLFDANDSIDLFAGYINKGAANRVGFYNPGTGANVSPSTTTIDTGSPIYSEAAGDSNLLWTAVTVGALGNDTRWQGGPTTSASTGISTISPHGSCLSPSCNRRLSLVDSPSRPQALLGLWWARRSR
jgi:hypothetical protein